MKPIKYSRIRRFLYWFTDEKKDCFGVCLSEKPGFLHVEILLEKFLLRTPVGLRENAQTGVCLVFQASAGLFLFMADALHHEIPDR